MRATTTMWAGLLVLVVAGAGGCDDGTTPKTTCMLGTPDCTCDTDEWCVTGYVCEDGVCVEAPAGSAGAAGTSGADGGANAGGAAGSSSMAAGAAGTPGGAGESAAAGAGG
jgi:hypothetical protein